MIKYGENGSIVSHAWAKFSTRVIKQEGRYLNQVTHQWVEEGHDPPKLWENKHWMTCTHRSGHFVVIRQAEQVCVFEEVGANRIHISVCVEGWFQCKTIPSEQWHGMTSLQLIEFVSEELKNLKQIAGM